jgi:sugar O-acyltransferase (sialic acid O-acetyltransferase NeuD family)
VSGRGFVIVVWGGRGQATVLRPIIEQGGHRIGVIFDRDPAVTSPFPGVPCLHEWEALLGWIAEHRHVQPAFAIAIGGDHGRERLDIHERMVGHGLRPITLVHQRAWVADTARLGEGAQVCAMAAVGEETTAGRQCIINTSASVDHECRLGDGVHIMPGATLAGCVEVGDRAMIGSGAVVLPRVRIGSDARVGAGAVVTEDVARGATVVGSAARPLR